MKKKEKKILKKTLSLKIFPRTIVICIVDTDFEIEGCQLNSQTPGYVNQNGCMYLWKRAEPEVIIHEIIHMVDLIFTSLDSHPLPLMSSTEIRAYMGGWLYSEIQNLLKQTKPIHSRRCYGKTNKQKNYR